MAMSDLTQEGSFKPVQFKLLNEYDEEIVVDFEETDNSPLEDDSDGKNTMLDSEDLDEVVFILDNHNVANRGYHALAKIHHFLPRAHQINKRRKQLNSMIEIKEVDGEYLGAYTSLTAMIIRKLENEHNPNLIQDGKVRIKLSGDGTRITCKQNFVNMAITFPDEEQCMSEHGNYLLAIVKCPEKNVSLKAAIHNLIEEFENIQVIEVEGRPVTVDKYLAGDLKFLNQIMGISSFAGKYSCLWCYCSSSERFDMSKTWSCTDESKGARTIETILKCSTKKASDPTKHCVVETPLFQSVPTYKVVVDTLHLCLRICDQLVGHLVSYLQTKDKFHLRQILRSVDICSAFVNL